MKLRVKAMIWNIRKQKTTNQKQQKENINKKKDEDTGRRLWDNFKLTNIHIIGMPEEEEKEQEIGNLKK